jgi:hypothetical protein
VSSHHVLVEAPSCGSSRAVLPPASLHAVAPVLLAVGVVLTIAGLVDVGLFYWPLRFGDAEWEFGIIAQTFDTMPLPTLGLALVAIGLWARGGRPLWSRAMAIIFLLVAVLLAILSVIFLLDVPVALKALARAVATAKQRGATPNPVVSSGLHRGIAKAALFAATYVVGYATMAVALWRGVRRALREGASS